eukprot:CAMPEP_0172571250 /NCGR_PEP_ID=MMETSP1067-20121228/130632_1 /TAXON_ID=265564 ORGANISM="Thalassiosira punctigera, Strain Tpunct2005C2" /NCGR_SAMPLE_ID=MMETSP1067 /ASSEMBLY_ACC=CAM_ASM_000444 /LENGTH=36 /DNA_ID= /DNA_START= /DNA_END= /DNA_ORIENTATION=
MDEQVGSLRMSNRISGKGLARLEDDDFAGGRAECSP